MLTAPKTASEAKIKRYARWAGNPDGLRFQPARCAAEVSSGWVYCQCSRKPGHGPEELYCRQHAAMFHLIP